MEPQDDHFTKHQYNQQQENYLMEETSNEFRLPELPELNRSHSNNNPSHLQQGQLNRKDTIRAANNGGDITTVQHTVSPNNNETGQGNDNQYGPPPGFGNQMAQSKSNGLSSGNSSSSLTTTYMVQAPSSLPVQWCTSPAQTSSLVQPAVSAMSSPNPPPPVLTTTLQAHSNPIQTLVSNIAQSAGQNGNPSPASASTHHPQASNNPPPPPGSTNMPPPQAPCKNNTTKAPVSNTNYVPPSTNDTHLQQAPQSDNVSHLAPNPYPPAAADQPVAIDNAGSSSIASRFAAAAHGASMGNMRTQYLLPYAPSGYMTFPRPNSIDLSSQHCGAYVQGVPQMDAAGGYGAQVVPFNPQMAVAAGGGQETGLLPMYPSSTLFHDMALMTHRDNSNFAKKKQQRKEGLAAKNPRGRPKGSGNRKRNPPPQWDQIEYDLREIAQHARKPYNVRRAEWQDLKLAGAITAGQAPIMNSLPGGDPMAIDDGGVWNNYPRPIMMNNPTISYDHNQGQSGDLTAVGILSTSNHTPPDQVVGANPNHVHVHHQPSATHFGNEASEAVHPVPPRHASTHKTFGDAAPVENPSKFWSFGTNSQLITIPFPPSQVANNNYNENMSIMHPRSAQSNGKQAIEHHTMLQSGNNNCAEFGTAGSSSNKGHQSQGKTINNNTTSTANVRGMRGSFSNPVSHESTMEPPIAANNIQYWGGGHRSTCIDFENECFQVAVNDGQGRPTLSQGPKRSASAAQYEDAVATQVAAEQGNPCNQQPLGSASAVESNNNNPPLNSNTSVPTPMPPADNQVDAAIQYPISISDYFNDYDGMQLTDEDYIACALRDQIIAQPTGQTIQQQQLQVTTQPTHLSGNAPHPLPSEVVNEQLGIAQQTALVPATTITQPMQSFVAGQHVSTLGVSHTNNSSEQLRQQADNNLSGNNNKSSSGHPPPQPFQQNPSAQYQLEQDGSNSVHQAYMQQHNTFYHTYNAASAHQGMRFRYSSKVSANSIAHQTTRPQILPRTSGPTDFYYQQHLQQQAYSSVNGPRPYAMLPPPGPQHQVAPGFMINRPLMQHQYYQYGGTGNFIPPPKTTRRRQNTQPAHYPVIDFNECAITPIMFDDMVHDGSVDSILGSDLWAGLNQDVYNTMVTADPSLLMDPGRLQERIAQINSGMMPIASLLNAIRKAQPAAGFSAPQAANRVTGNSNMINYAPPNGMQPNPTTQQGLGVAVDATSYKSIVPNAMVPQMMMNANDIPSVLNQQPPNNIPGGQMNTNMQQGQPNFGYLHEYPAPPLSGQIPEEMQQQIPVNQPSAQEKVNYNPPLLHVAPPPNTQQTPDQAYNNTTDGFPYARGGPPYVAPQEMK